jgi:hypothetical protein
LTVGQRGERQRRVGEHRKAAGPARVVGADEALPQPIDGPHVPRHPRLRRLAIGRQGREHRQTLRVEVTARAFHGDARLAAQRLVETACHHELGGRVGDAPRVTVPCREPRIVELGDEQLCECEPLVQLPGDEQLLDHPQIVEVTPHVIAPRRGILKRAGVGGWGCDSNHGACGIIVQSSGSSADGRGSAAHPRSTMRVAARARVMSIAGAITVFCR